MCRMLSQLLTQLESLRIVNVCFLTIPCYTMCIQIVSSSSSFSYCLLCHTFLVNFSVTARPFVFVGINHAAAAPDAVYKVMLRSLSPTLLYDILVLITGTLHMTPFWNPWDHGSTLELFSRFVSPSG